MTASSSSRPNISKVEPSPLIGRLQAFLPQIARANAELDAKLKRDPAARAQVDVEQVVDDADYVLMDVHCGLMDPPAAAPPAPEHVIAEPRHDDDDDDDDHDGDDDDGVDRVAAASSKIEELS